MSIDAVLVDSSVLLDILTKDAEWYDWSTRTLEKCADEGILAINPIIYAEVSLGFERIEDLDEALPPTTFMRLSLPWDAGFLAGRCFRRYRQRGGERRSPLPDFYIGAHAAVRGMRLATRDPVRFRTYFPGLRIVAP